MIQLIIPGKPHAQARPRFSTRTKRAYDPDSNVIYRQLVHKELQKFPGPPLEGPLSVYLLAQFYRKSQQITEWHIGQKDIDNIAKAVLDACNGKLWVDDGQVCSLYAQKIYMPDPSSECVIVQVSPVRGKVTTLFTSRGEKNDAARSEGKAGDPS